MPFSDLLFQFTEWLRTTPVNDFSLWISNTALCLWIGEHFWTIPIIQTIHILSICAGFGSVLMINFRILGLGGSTRSMSQTVQRYLPWIWWSLLLLILSGIGMIIGEPVRELVNPIFWIKMGLVILVILSSLWFQTSVGKNVSRWDGTGSARFGAVLVTILWCAVMFGGRWIAYAPV
jgi:hypothetical protein